MSRYGNCWLTRRWKTRVMKIRTGAITLVRQVQHSQLELVANFADISLRLSQILKLKPGDVLPIEEPDRIIAMLTASRC